jgi:hypothetical protein
MTDTSVPATIPEAVEKLADLLSCKVRKGPGDERTIVLDHTAEIELTVAPDVAPDNDPTGKYWQFQIVMRRRKPSHDPDAIEEIVRAALKRMVKHWPPRFPQ